ncbi:ABC transporter ATP-binding protein [Caloramator sp. E03]|uniref:sulfate/molybdate ABC transporter ATP-binding protein n=1 Tax=Caloramator sp. E03 TaxID=2576307 RepID=UPI001110BF47|nr:ABC transporter ATP-binding protein [Caloramator sp. E03]QCX33641.1 ABC transporter ATP-binding protein [Caloramator sp. E03]
MLEVSISKTIGNFKLTSSFCCEKEILGIIGPSGCGKSMTLKCIAGIFTPDDGYIRLYGKELFNSYKKINVIPQQRNIGYVFQNYALFPHLTVYENIAYGISKIEKKIRHNKVMDMIDKMQLNGLEKRYPSQLSGGQQQRVALARSLITEPKLLLLDEPFSALDTNVRNTLRKELLNIVRQRYNGIVILVTHDIEEAYEMSNKILIMNDGRVVQAGDKKEVIRNPASLIAARITGCKNFFDAKLIGKEGEYTIIKSKEIMLYVKKNNFLSYSNIIAGVRAEDITILQENNGKLNTFNCKIIDIIEGLSHTMIIADCMGIPLEVQVSNNDTYLKNKERILLHIPPDRIFLLK